MNDAQLELLRGALLRVLDAGPARGLTAEAVAGLVVRFGHEIDEATATRELTYLADKGFVAQVAQPLNPRNTAWRITAAGRDAL